MADEFDLRQLPPGLVEALGNYVADKLSRNLQLPPPAAPSGVITGADVRSIQALNPDMGALERVVGMLIQQRVNEFLTREQILRLVTEDPATKTWVVNMIRDEMGEIGLLVDTPEHKEATGTAMRSQLKWQRRIDTIWNTFFTGLIISGLYALAKMLGINLPSVPGSGG